MSKEQLLPESVKEVLTEESINTIEDALKDKITLSVESALTSQDELYSEKLQELVKAIDKDHSAKLTRIVEAVDSKNTKQLVKVIKKYENDLSVGAKEFKDTLVESISDYLEEYIDEAVPAEAVLEATQNRTAMEVLNNLRNVLAVDSSLMSESVKEAVIDGKTQIEELKSKLETVQKENALIKEAYNKTKADLLLENKTAKLSAKKAEYLRKVLNDKTPKFIEENFEYTARLFDKKESERIDVIKEEAFTNRKVKADAPVQKIVQEKKEISNPYLEELTRMK
tara:strand:- start:4320 stop:5168 length:849 start_codon:yes stop_codon:yes gene_type:complete